MATTPAPHPGCPMAGRGSMHLTEGPTPRVCIRAGHHLAGWKPQCVGICLLQNWVLTVPTHSHSLLPGHLTIGKPPAAQRGHRCEFCWTRSSRPFCVALECATLAFPPPPPFPVRNHMLILLVVTRTRHVSSPRFDPSLQLLGSAHDVCRDSSLCLRSH